MRPKTHNYDVILAEIYVRTYSNSYGNVLKVVTVKSIAKVP